MKEIDSNPSDVKTNPFVFKNKKVLLFSKNRLTLVKVSESFILINLNPVRWLDRVTCHLLHAEASF
jgi:hypothetical protein